VSVDAVLQPTYPLFLQLEHMVKLQVFGNNSKTVRSIKNLTWGKNDQHILGYRTVLTDTFLKGDHPRIISAKFG
jgi:hypothetical protein